MAGGRVVDLGRGGVGRGTRSFTSGGAGGAPFVPDRNASRSQAQGVPKGPPEWSPARSAITSMCSAPVGVRQLRRGERPPCKNRPTYGKFFVTSNAAARAITGSRQRKDCSWVCPLRFPLTARLPCESSRQTRGLWLVDCPPQDSQTAEKVVLPNDYITRGEQATAPPVRWPPEFENRVSLKADIRARRVGKPRP